MYDVRCQRSSLIAPFIYPKDYGTYRRQIIFANLYSKVHCHKIIALGPAELGDITDSWQQLIAEPSNDS